MIKTSFWNLIIGVTLVLVLVVISPKDSRLTNPNNYDETSSIKSQKQQMQYLGMALVFIILPELVQVIFKCCNQSTFKSNSGILYGRILNAIMTLVFGLHLSLQSSIFDYISFETGSLMLINCYRIVYSSTLFFFLSNTHSSKENVYSTVLLNTLFCSLICLYYFFKPQENIGVSLLLIILLVASVYIFNKGYKIWFKKHSYSYSHILYLYFFLLAIVSAVGIRVLVVLYYQDISAANSANVSIFTYVINTLAFAVIPGLIAEQEVIQNKDNLTATKESYQRYIFHEMKSPLNSTVMGVLHCLDLIPKDTTDLNMIDMRNTLCDVKNSTEEGLKIMEDMLFFDKFQNGNVMLQKEEVSVKSLILDCLDILKIQIKNKGINLQMFNCADKIDTNIDMSSTTTNTIINNCLPINEVMTGFTNVISSEVGFNDFVKDSDIIYVDKAKWSQVYGNVLSNAIKFTPKDGKVALSVTYVPKQVSNEILNESITNIETNFFYTFFKNLYNTFINTDSKKSYDYYQMIVDENQPSTKMNQISSKNSTMVNTVDKMPSQSGMLVVEIQDSGAGISLENQARLFKEIVQFNPHKLQAGGGSGLGMCISKGIVDMHGGRISVHSEGEGKGTKFRIEIPMIRNPNAIVHKDDKTISSKTNSVDLSEDLPPFVKKKKILIVDDADSNRKMLRKRLIQRGHDECDEANDGTVAVEMIKSIMISIHNNHSENESIKQYDVIFMDYMMRDMNGPEATRLIRTLGFTGLIIGATGNSLDNDKAYFINAGLDDIIVKPLRMPEICQKANL